MFLVFEPVSEVQQHIALSYVWCFNFPYIWPVFVRLISLVGSTSVNADHMIVNEYLQDFFVNGFKYMHNERAYLVKDLLFHSAANSITPVASAVLCIYFFREKHWRVSAHKLLFVWLRSVNVGIKLHKIWSKGVFTITTISGVPLHVLGECISCHQWEMRCEGWTDNCDAAESIMCIISS